MISEKAALPKKLEVLKDEAIEAMSKVRSRGEAGK